MYTIKKETKDELFSLVTSADFDLKRIVIADYEIDDHCLTLYLEDKNDFKETFDQCVQLNISIEEFGAFIKRNEYNSYAGTNVHSKGFIYPTRIEINQPIKFYREDATSQHQEWMREELVEEILKEILASVTHG